MLPCYAVALQISAEPLLTVAVLCNSIASRLKANPLRSFARQFQAMPSRFDSSQCHCQTMLCRSVPRPCIPVRVDSLLCHSFTPPCKTLLRPAFAVLCITPPCHCFSGHIKATRSDTQPSRVTASQCFAFAVLRKAALFSAIAPRCVDLRYDSILCISFAVPLGTAPRRCDAPPGLAVPGRCFARRAYQPAFSSGKKFASCTMQPNFSAVPPRLFPSSSSIL